MASFMRASGNVRCGACTGLPESPGASTLSRLHHRRERETTELQSRSLPPNRVLHILRTTSAKMPAGAATGGDCGRSDRRSGMRGFMEMA